MVYATIYYQRPSDLKSRYHAVGDDGSRSVRGAGEEAGWVARVQHQRLLLRHFRQVAHREQELTGPDMI